MNAELLERAVKGEKNAREQMVEENSGLIWSIVRRFFGRGVDADDLYQLGCLGFIKALDGFDLEFGTQFSTYAVPKIAGEIRRFLRDDGTVKVSRTIKEQSGAIKTARQSLMGSMGRDPTVEEVAEVVGLTPQEIAVIETAMLPADSLQRPTGEDGCTLQELLPGEGIEEKIIESLSLQDAITRLDPRQRAVINMRYFRCMTQEKIAVVLGVSQVQVSRIERKALVCLKEFLVEG